MYTYLEKNEQTRANQSCRNSLILVLVATRADVTCITTHPTIHALVTSCNNLRFLITMSCRRAILLQYFGENISADATCHSLGGALCDNCQALPSRICSQGESDFKIIANATSDIPNHGIAKVLYL